MFKSDEIDIKYYWSVIRRRNRVILAAVGSCVLLATIVNLVTPPTYRATTRIQVNKEPTRSALTGEAIASDDWRSDNIAMFTTAELITARSLMRDVAATLYRRGILGAHGSAPRKGPAASHGSADGGDAPAVDLDRDVDWLLSIMTVKPIPQTRLVSIEVDHNSPRIAREVADVVALKFVEYQKDQRSHVDGERVDYLKQQTDELAGDINGLEKKLYDSRQAGLAVLESRLKQLTETSAGLNDSYVKTRVERGATGSRLARLREALRDSTGMTAGIPMQSETLDGLRKNLQLHETDLAKAREIYKDKHPKLIILESEIESIRGCIRAELEKSVAALQEEYTGIQEREANLRASIAQTDAQMRAVNDRLSQSTAMEGDLSSKRNLRTMLVGKVHEAEISGQVEQPLATVVEAATVGEDPVRPRKGLNLMIGAVVGLLGGLGLALLFEYLRHCIRSPKDVTEHLRLPVLGMIPRRV